MVVKNVEKETRIQLVDNILYLSTHVILQQLSLSWYELFVVYDNYSQKTSIFLS